MKNFFKDFDFSSKNILKILGVGFLGLICLVIAVWLIGFAFRVAFWGGSSNYSEQVYYAPTTPQAVVKSDSDISLRNVALDSGGGVVEFYDEEDYEVTEYHGTIKTRNFEEACGKVEDLKSADYIIFENSNKNERNCFYTFKVENEKVEEVLSLIEDLKPESLQTNKYTIKNVVDDYTSEIDILTKKLESVEKTLAEAQEAYDDVTVLATRNQDVESLAKIIDSKLQLIERLTEQRIDTKEKIDRLNRQKAEQVERLKYTVFNLSIYDVVIFDFKQIKNSWITELKNFVQEFNDVLQQVTVGLATYLLRLVQVAIYLLIALFVIKYGWKVVKYIWNPKKK